MCHVSYVICHMCVIGVRFRFPARLSIGRGSKSCTNTNTRQGIGDAVTARNLYFWNSWKQMSQSQPSIKRSSKVLCATTQKIDLCRIHHQESVIWATFPPMDALWSVAKVSKALFPDKVCKTMAGVSKCPREQKFCFQQVRNYRFPSWDQKAGRKSSVYFWFDLNKKCSAIIEHTL